MQNLFLIRHPAAQALSLMRLDWRYSASIYFERPEFLAQYFSSAQIEYGNKILAEGSNFQKAILSWICDVIYPLKYSKQVSCQLFYEHLIDQPEVWIQYLCEILKLQDSDLMKQLMNQPSGSSSLSTSDINSAIAKGDSRHLLRKWDDKITPSERKNGQEVLDCFEIKCYTMYDIMPIQN
ncbi:MAG: hypothetical protein AAGA83_11915, partial [Cyanobacteria bacterium P01_F01_bin.116]